MPLLLVGTPLGTIMPHCWYEHWPNHQVMLPYEPQVPNTCCCCLCDSLFYNSFICDLVKLEQWRGSAGAGVIFNGTCFSNLSIISTFLLGNISKQLNCTSVICLMICAVTRDAFSATSSGLFTDQSQCLQHCSTQYIAGLQTLSQRNTWAYPRFGLLQAFASFSDHDGKFASLLMIGQCQNVSLGQI